MSNRFTGKVALVVGGAHADESKSLGFAGLSALEIARAGGKVVIADIDDEAGEQSAAKMRDDGLTARYVHLDVTSEPDWDAAVESTVSEHGRLDITIMAAGVNDRGNPIETTDVDVWQRVMDVTNLGMFLAVKSSVRPMRESGGGSIVLISSMMARIVRQNSSAYATSRAGMTHFARSAAVQYGPDNIRVNCIAPGLVYTPMVAHRMNDEQRENKILRLQRAKSGNQISNNSKISNGQILKQCYYKTEI